MTSAVFQEQEKKLLSDVSTISQLKNDLDEDIVMLNKGEGSNRIFRTMKCVVVCHGCVGLPVVCAVSVEGRA